ncbi:putative signal transducing protein [Chloroflexota bacterium]
MWTEVRQANNLMLAEMWKELFEGEGIPARIMPAYGEPMGQEAASYRILVPEDKKHVIEEVLRKL